MSDVSSNTFFGYNLKLFWKAQLLQVAHNLLYSTDISCGTALSLV